MMRLPDTMPLHLMLAMMQSGISPNAFTPWSDPSANYMASFFPWAPKPKSPLEQTLHAAQSQWQNQSAQWQESVSQWFQSLSPKQSPDPKPEQKNSDAFADFFNPDFLTSLGQQAFGNSTGFLQGMQAYLASDYERPETHHEVLWAQGSARLLDLAPERADALAVLCIPSLINQSTILDLYPGRSFAEYLKSQGFRPLILDWGTPGEDELEFATADYINAYALTALQALREAHDGPIALLGYCMGGIFATAMAQLAPLYVDGLVLLATPWDFSAEDTPRILLDPSTQLMLRQWIAGMNPVPPLITQTIFHLIDPWRIQKKYSRYPSLSEAEKTHFLAVEQWVNEGVPLTQRVAEECFVDWPQGNLLATHKWKVGRKWIEPEAVQCPSLAIMPTRDLIVPLGTARPLTCMLLRCDVLTPDVGHVSMVVGKHAKNLVWEPVVKWLKAKF